MTSVRYPQQAFAGRRPLSHVTKELELHGASRHASAGEPIAHVRFTACTHQFECAGTFRFI